MPLDPSAMPHGDARPLREADTGGGLGETIGAAVTLVTQARTGSEARDSTSQLDFK